MKILHTSFSRLAGFTHGSGDNPYVARHITPSQPSSEAEKTLLPLICLIEYVCGNFCYPKMMEANKMDGLVGETRTLPASSPSQCPLFSPPNSCTSPPTPPTAAIPLSWFSHFSWAARSIALTGVLERLQTGRVRLLHLPLAMRTKGHLILDDRDMSGSVGKRIGESSFPTYVVLLLRSDVIGDVAKGGVVMQQFGSTAIGRERATANCLERP
ncbi:uncharacterized protein BDR25DRAFT_358501 [Lindgomyces ingoldianus]|uniref:Uncharacterized protein n=1 Tax=Lindgomyces ingoldianus TaxID=673940 RepID=A0ACB6QMQ4_9PLEO|nr:uncharacterized protein BDR25DRAFT_358501 [Lindgomyces ingoldianus]KAF2467390.1 hypothetical protein BDR25DRAFT_358501 [Lindgomyces ingoldianus]